jgi:hypothetical protein
MPISLKPLPESFGTTRDALHRVAEELVAPARKPHNEIALRQTPGGFGTPPFEFEDERLQVRVEDGELVLSRDQREERAELASLAQASELLGPELLPDGLPSDTEPLGIDPLAADRVADYYAFAAELLRYFRGSLPPEAAASDINLWPEHFDIAFEAGSEAAGQRANYGASPGDEDHPEPYLYVGPWNGEVKGPLWNATSFTGAELSYAELLASADAADIALEFLEARLGELSGAG